MDNKIFDKYDVEKENESTNTVGAEIENITKPADVSTLSKPVVDSIDSAYLDKEENTGDNMQKRYGLSRPKKIIIEIEGEIVK